MKRAFFAALTMLAAPAMAEQTVAHHFATLEYQRIIDGCQMYRLNTPQGATLLFGHNFNDTGVNAEGGASAGTMDLYSYMYSDPKYRSYFLRGTNNLYRPSTSDSYTFMTLSVGAGRSPDNFMLSQRKNIERATSYSSGDTQLSMHFYDGQDQPKYDKAMPKYLSLCGSNIASFEPLTSLRLRIASSTIKVQYPRFNQPAGIKASNDLVSEVQLAWSNADNSAITTRQHKYTRISRAEKLDKPQDQKFVELAKLGINDDRYIDINGDQNPLIPGKEYVYQVQYCDDYDFCEASPQVIGKAN
ncbi:fibronectin type III domain-containing protein [Aeromonas hydrophila]|uniref:hypothetical protein n=1 Tax=Aeromonas hydrophila TaxID=644 RepID=UPI0023664373|nr:hypothetical protein [Aeromonas hydrophila]WDF92472.1 hypothetical protein PUB83_09470 [Aeromonas hydrophila subsp. hydrophila]